MAAPNPPNTKPNLPKQILQSLKPYWAVQQPLVLPPRVRDWLHIEGPVHIGSQLVTHVRSTSRQNSTRGWGDVHVGEVEGSPALLNQVVQRTAHHGNIRGKDIILQPAIHQYGKAAFQAPQCALNRQ